MKLHELKTVLRAHPEAQLRLLLPQGEEVPAHFHITEVGYVTRRFIDCGGAVHPTSGVCLLQTHVGNDHAHRLSAGRFASILELGGKVLPGDDLEVEVEYDCCVTAQYPIAAARETANELAIELGARHTACLAQPERASGSCCCS